MKTVGNSTIFSLQLTSLLWKKQSLGHSQRYKYFAAFSVCSLYTVQRVLRHVSSGDSEAEARLLPRALSRRLPDSHLPVPQVLSLQRLPHTVR